MAEMLRVFVLVIRLSSVNGSKTAICAGGVEASELKFGEQDPFRQPCGPVSLPAYAHPAMICARVMRGSEDWDIGL